MSQIPPNPNLVHVRLLVQFKYRLETGTGHGKIPSVDSSSVLGGRRTVLFCRPGDQEGHPNDQKA
ncbi:hypothetical protein PCANC_26580 [Puccinia coronata f. sp. avenae]|uniref:Uncharacterized protein n=1 Tax=Puccinia coronata f. sp. avenae TaxID=200324 RepID=A0A2N5TTD4_9BASI|nr:hypothetical protein PCANC_26580 [Puccinia coronata f. sp. avenae]